MKNEPQKHSKYAFVCATPYQIYNILTFIFASQEKYEGNADLFVVGGFTGAEKVAKTIFASHLFAHVTFVPAKLDAYGLGEEKLKNPGETRTLENLIDYLAILPSDEFELPENGYNEISFSLPTLTAAYLIEMSPDARIILFDDGYGSYYDNLLETSGWTRRMPDEMHVWFPQMCKTTIPCIVYGMPDINDDNQKDRFKKFISDIFGYQKLSHIENNNATRMMFLSQPIHEQNLLANANESIKNILNIGIDNDMIVIAKPHPRETPEDVVSIPEAIMDERGLSLEVLCINDEINNDTVMVGAFSTSQYLPAMMFDIYPKLLFLYRIMLSDENEIKRLDTLVEDVSVTYGNKAKDRICVANTLDDAVLFLR